jgi:hypothetical protein
MAKADHPRGMETPSMMVAKVSARLRRVDDEKKKSAH